MMKSVARTIRKFAGLLLTAGAIVAVAMFALTATGTAHFVPVLSNSMAPDMPKGSLAVVTPVPAQDVTAGAVIVFTAPDGTHRRVIHRVAHRYGPEEAGAVQGWRPDKLFLTTAGDNNPGPDPWILVLAETTVWQQRTVVPHAGWPIIGLSDPTHRMIAFGTSGAAIAAWALLHIWRRPAAEAPPTAAAPEPTEDLTARATTDTLT